MIAWSKKNEHRACNGSRKFCKAWRQELYEIIQVILCPQPITSNLFLSRTPWEFPRVQTIAQRCFFKWNDVLCFTANHTFCTFAPSTDEAHKDYSMIQCTLPNIANVTYDKVVIAGTIISIDALGSASQHLIEDSENCSMPCVHQPRQYQRWARWQAQLVSLAISEEWEKLTLLASRNPPLLPT